jgi:uncharacterized protein GlcG (DUF336 family)
MLGTTKYITLEAAKKIVSAGEAEARKNGWNVAISIVDANGDLIMFQKLDETQRFPRGRREPRLFSNGRRKHWRR